MIKRGKKDSDVQDLVGNMSNDRKAIIGLESWEYLMSKTDRDGGDFWTYGGS